MIHFHTQLHCKIPSIKKKLIKYINLDHISQINITKIGKWRLNSPSIIQNLKYISITTSEKSLLCTYLYNLLLFSSLNYEQIVTTEKSDLEIWL